MSWKAQRRKRVRCLSCTTIKEGPVHGPQSNPRPPRCVSHPKTERASSERLSKPGAGRRPAILSPCFLIKKAGPPPGRRAPGALRPEAGPRGRTFRARTASTGPRPHVPALSGAVPTAPPADAVPPAPWGGTKQNPPSGGVPDGGFVSWWAWGQRVVSRSTRMLSVPFSSNSVIYASIRWASSA